MGDRVVLRLSEYSMTLKSFQEFLDTCGVLGLGPRGKIVYSEDSEGHPCLVANLPEKAAEALEKERRLKTPTKVQTAVRDQLQGRREAVKAGNPLPGHLPAVAKGGKVLKTGKKKND